MPSRGISSGYALFVKVKNDVRAKNIIFSSRRKRLIPVTADIAPLKLSPK